MDGPAIEFGVGSVTLEKLGALSRHCCFCWSHVNVVLLTFRGELLLPLPLCSTDHTHLFSGSITLQTLMRFFSLSLSLSPQSLGNYCRSFFGKSISRLCAKQMHSASPYLISPFFICQQRRNLLAINQTPGCR